VCSSDLVCDGQLEHNDHVLAPEERASGRRIMICVSRITGGTVKLDL
jgi:hypothetical protein